MTEVPIVVNTDEITVGGYVDQIDLQLSVGSEGQRGSRIFSGDVSPLTLNADDPSFAGYTEFIAGDTYIERSDEIIAVWEWKSQLGGYTWVKTAEIATYSDEPDPLDADLVAIGSLSGTSGLLKKTATNTWTLDNSSYLPSERIQEGTDPSTAPNMSIYYDTDASDPPTVLTLSQANANYANRLTSTTDNGIPRFDGTGGSLQTSLMTIADNGEAVLSGNFIMRRDWPSFVLEGSKSGSTVKPGSIYFQSGTNNQRWVIGATDDAESGTNAGSNFQIIRYDDSSSSLGTALSINRASGETTFSSGIYVSKSAAGVTSMFATSGTYGINERSAQTDVYDQYKVGGYNRFTWRAQPNELHLYVANDSGDIWTGLGAVLSIARATGKVTLKASGSSAGLELGSSGPRIMSGTGSPSGVTAPIGSTWRQTDANSTYGNLTGLLWNKVGSGTTVGTDWLVDFEGRWISYTPTLTASSSNPTNWTQTGYYTMSGKRVAAKFMLTAGASMTAGSGTYRIAFPTNSVTTINNVIVGSALGYDSNPGAFKVGVVRINNAAYCEIIAESNSGFTNTFPWTWAASDTISGTLIYEAA